MPGWGGGGDSCTAALGALTLPNCPLQVVKAVHLMCVLAEFLKIVLKMSLSGKTERNLRT